MPVYFGEGVGGGGVSDGALKGFHIGLYISMVECQQNC